MCSAPCGVAGPLPPLAGLESGRGLMLGGLRAARVDPDQLFTGARHAPAPVDPAETARAFASAAERLDIPDWLWPEFNRSLGAETEQVAMALQTRAPVFLRVNVARCDLPTAIRELERDGIAVQPHDECDTALEVTEGARKVAQSQAYSTGLVELQDAASQAVTGLLDLRPGMRVLDYCAGGGGKALAMAAHSGVEVFAHDVSPDRMRDLPARAARAGVGITRLSSAQLAENGPYDLVLTDVPCSGSGSWRRAPAGKWALDADRLAALGVTQLEILRAAAPLVAQGGTLAYATCSVLDVENRQVVDRFLSANPDWRVTVQKSWPVSHGGDGFYSAHLTRA